MMATAMRILDTMLMTLETRPNDRIVVFRPEQISEEHIDKWLDWSTYEGILDILGLRLSEVSVFSVQTVF